MTHSASYVLKKTMCKVLMWFRSSLSMESLADNVLYMEVHAYTWMRTARHLLVEMVQCITYVRRRWTWGRICHRNACRALPENAWEGAGALKIASTESQGALTVYYMCHPR
jgi:hypothetical protein